MSSSIASRRLEVLRLEDRTVPATLIWTGDVDDRWGTNNLGNTNWAFDLLPHNGDSLVFPSNAQRHSNTNNLSGLVVNNLTEQFSPITVDGNAITLTGNFVDSSAGSTQGSHFPMPITMAPGAHTFTISSSSGGDATSTIGESGGTASLIKDGAGTLVFSGSSGNTYTGLTTVNAGILVLATQGIAVAGNLLINNGIVTDNDNLIADTAVVTVNSGGAFDLLGHTDTVGPLHVASGGALNTTGFNQCHLTAGNLWLESGSRLTMQVGNLNGPSDRITVNGPVQLGGTLHLSIGSSVSVGAAITLIENDGTQPVISPFDGLPQGATLAADDGSLFTIDYALRAQHCARLR